MALLLDTMRSTLLQYLGASIDFVYWSGNENPDLTITLIRFFFSYT